MSAFLLRASRMIHRCVVASNRLTGLARSCGTFTWHQVGTQTMRIGSDLLKIWLPALQFLFGITQDLTSFSGALEWLTNIARDDWGIVERVKQTTSVFGKDGLFLGALDRCGEMKVICFLEFLTRLVEVSSGTKAILAHIRY